MDAADIYAGLVRAGNANFDAHVVASVLAIGAGECGPSREGLPRAVGLDGRELAAWAGELFPHAAAFFAGLAGCDAGAPADDEACLRDLLRRSTTDGTLLERRLADMVARRCLRPNHLWQDLGLRSRRELSALMTRHFAPLAARNRNDMKWKKFFYRTICRDDGFLLCSAPVCAECCDFDVCFGEESGESLLAHIRNPQHVAA